MCDLTRALTLVDAIVQDVEAWSKTPAARMPAGDDEEEARYLAAREADFAARFGAELEAVGVARYLAAAFIRVDLTTQADPDSAMFFWRPRLEWADVLEIARCLAHHHEGVYHFAWFAWRELGLDVRALAEQPEIPGPVRRELQSWMRRASVHTVSDGRFLAPDQSYGVRSAALEARLRAGGAPMLQK